MTTMARRVRQALKPMAAVAKSLTYLQHTGDGTSQTTYTFAGVNLGTAAAGRWIVCGIASRRGSGVDITVDAVTIGGVTASEIVDAQNSPGVNGCVAAIYVANVPTGTTGDVVVTFNGAMTRASIDLWEATGLSTTPTDTDSSTADPGTATLDTTASGVAVAVTVTGGSQTFTWTNATERYDGLIQTTGARCSVADASTSAGTLAITADGSAATSDPITVFATW